MKVKVISAPPFFAPHSRQKFESVVPLAEAAGDAQMDKLKATGTDSSCEHNSGLQNKHNIININYQY